MLTMLAIDKHVLFLLFTVKYDFKQWYGVLVHSNRIRPKSKV